MRPRSARQVPIIDHHAHFTGSLPLSLVLRLAIERHRYEGLLTRLGEISGARRAEYAKPSLPTLRHALQSAVKSGVTRGPARYFDIYGAVREALGVAQGDRSEKYSYYAAGFAGIQRRVRSEGCDEQHLFLAVPHDPEVLDLKIAAACAVLSRHPTVKLRLTFSRERFRGNTAALERMLGFLADRLARDERYSRLVSGLDISGLDMSADRLGVVELMEELVPMASEVRGLHRKSLVVSAHSGENLSQRRAVDVLHELEGLLAAGVQSIAHAVPLWIDERSLRRDSLVSHWQGYQRERAALLREAIRRGVRVELCPTTSLLTQPLGVDGHRQLRSLGSSGLSIAIGTDAPVLLSTTAAREMEIYGPGAMPMPGEGADGGTAASADE